MAGMKRGSGTRSGLLWEVERLLKECNELPQVLLMENVPQVHGKKNKASFDEWCQFLESLGYKNYWKDLNAKDYGVPQSRNRCFMVSLLGDYSYEFPDPIELKLKLQDLLEDEVDEKYYLSSKLIEFYTNNTEMQEQKGNGFKFEPLEDASIAKTITTKSGSRMTDNYIKENHECGNRQPKIQVVGGVGEKRSNNGTQYFMQDRIYEGNISNAVCTCANPYYKLNDKLKTQMCNKLIQEGKVKENDVIRHNYTTSKNGNCIQSNNESPTLDTRCDCLGVCKNYRIRKLTPTECLRLMGVRDEYSKRMTCSNAQKYKQAGNGIVVDVLMAIFKQML